MHLPFHGSVTWKGQIHFLFPFSHCASCPGSTVPTQRRIRVCRCQWTLSCLDLRGRGGLTSLSECYPSPAGLRWRLMWKELGSVFPRCWSRALMVFMELPSACRGEMTVLSVLNGPGVAGGEHIQGGAFFLSACRVCAGCPFRPFPPWCGWRGGITSLSAHIWSTPWWWDHAALNPWRPRVTRFVTKRYYMNASHCVKLNSGATICTNLFETFSLLLHQVKK